MTRRHSWLAGAMGVTLSLHSAVILAQPKPPKAATGDEEAKAEARIRFERGLALFDQKLWNPALTEFLASREKFSTRNATKNAAICLRNVGRFEESLEMFQAFKRDFATAPEAELRLIDTEIQKLVELVATVTLTITEPGATIVVDDRERGRSPLAAPLRLSAGEHKISVYKSGFTPWERRVEVAGQKEVAVSVDLRAIGAAGRLGVTEASGNVASVVVDNVTVGKTPWEGTIGPGKHVVWLTGDEKTGSQPASVLVKVNESASVTLPLEALPSELSVRASPPQAEIIVDGVPVAAGAWQGRLRAGAHKLEVGLQGFLPITRTLVVSPSERVDQNVALERDPDSPLWQASRPSHLVLEGAIGATTFFAVGGDVKSGCTGSCSSSLPLGWSARAYVGYQLPQGFGLAAFGGYARFGYTTESRATVARPVGRSTDVAAVLRDDVVAGGVMAGISPFYRSGEKWPWTLRIDAAAVFGRAYDDRSGVDPTNRAVTLPAGTTARAATHVLVAPSFELARRFDKQLDVGVRATLTMLYVPTAPSTSLETFGAENATFGANGGESYLGNVLMGAGLDLGARWLF